MVLIVPRSKINLPVLADSWNVLVLEPSIALSQDTGEGEGEGANAPHEGEVVGALVRKTNWHCGGENQMSVRMRVAGRG